jgi:phage terminase Nu1 subunit (DNA packaging protein)
MSPDSKPLSLRKYGERRGVQHVVVRRKIDAGILRDSVVWIDGSPKIADPDLADREWAANNDLTRAPAYVKDREAQRAASLEEQQDPEGGKRSAPPSPPVQRVGAAPPQTMAEASVAEKHWKAQLAQLEYQRKAGELVSASEVKAEITKHIIEAKSKILGVPSKARQRDGTLTLDQLTLFTELLREALGGLSDS